MIRQYHVQPRDGLANLKSEEVIIHKTIQEAEKEAFALCKSHPLVTVFDNVNANYKAFMVVPSDGNVLHTDDYTDSPFDACQILVDTHKIFSHHTTGDRE